MTGNSKNIIIADPRLDDFRASLHKPGSQARMLSQMARNRLKQGMRIILKNYFIIPKAIKNYILSVFGRYPLRSLEVAVGYECNYSCEQCSCALSSSKTRNRLTIQQFKDVIDQACDMGAFQFNLNGGEPMLYYDEVRELCAYIRGRGRYVHMATNGYLLNKDKIMSLRDAGLCSFEMGLDSSVEQLHDLNRGEGSFRKIMENTIIAQNFGLDVAYNTIGSKEKTVTAT